MSWRAAGWLPMVLILLLSTAGASDARPARKAKAHSGEPTPPEPAPGESLFENEPRPGPPVLRDPEILNRGEMLSLVRKYQAEITDALLDGERAREQAVRTKDSIKLSCIQDRLSNMKNMKKLSDGHLAATEREDIRRFELNLRHEFRGVEMSYQRVLELHRELRACVGETLTVAGEPGGIRDPSDSSGTNVEVPKIDRPVPASNYR